jgi:hypothetical protein
MMKLTFKEYLASKDQLRKAMENTPIAVIEYEVRKYCSLTIGESEDEKELVGLKPKQKVIVEWKYDNVDNPTPSSITFVGLKEVSEDEKHVTFWPGTKLQKWLSRHAKEGQNNGHKV